MKTSRPKNFSKKKSKKSSWTYQCSVGHQFQLDHQLYPGTGCQEMIVYPSFDYTQCNKPVTEKND